MGHLQRNVFPSILPILLSLVSLFGYSVFKVLDNHYVTAKVELINLLSTDKPGEKFISEQNYIYCAKMG
jgi:hypothetical protein